VDLQLWLHSVLGLLDHIQKVGSGSVNKQEELSLVSLSRVDCLVGKG
jgi:hypothetical protein